MGQQTVDLLLSVVDIDSGNGVISQLAYSAAEAQSIDMMMSSLIKLEREIVQR